MIFVCSRRPPRRVKRLLDICFVPCTPRSANGLLDICLLSLPPGERRAKGLLNISCLEIFSRRAKTYHELLMVLSIARTIKYQYESCCGQFCTRRKLFCHAFIRDFFLYVVYNFSSLRCCGVIVVLKIFFLTFMVGNNNIRNGLRYTRISLNKSRRSV